MSIDRLTRFRQRYYQWATELPQILNYCNTPRMYDVLTGTSHRHVRFQTYHQVSLRQSSTLSDINILARSKLLKKTINSGTTWYITESLEATRIQAISIREKREV